MRINFSGRPVDKRLCLLITSAERVSKIFKSVQRFPKHLRFAVYLVFEAFIFLTKDNMNVFANNFAQYKEPNPRNFWPFSVTIFFAVGHSFQKIGAGDDYASEK